MLSSLINTLFIDAGLLNLVVAVGFAFLAWRFWQVWEGESDRALMLFFGALTIDRVWSVVQKLLNAYCGAGYPLVMLLARNIILVAVIGAFANLFWVIRGGDSDNQES